VNKVGKFIKYFLLTALINVTIYH